MKNKINWKSVFTVMGAILAFNIGTGFATGQEVMQYFSVFGWWSILTGVAFAATMAAVRPAPPDVCSASLLRGRLFASVCR